MEQAKTGRVPEPNQLARNTGCVAAEHCCEDMAEQLKHVCDVHPDPYDCPDALVSYVPKFKEYGLIVHDGGSSSSTIAFCPWCGTRLPESARDRWFDEVTALGLDPWEDALPPEYEDERWLER